jgi:hypothetical protein
MQRQSGIGPHLAPFVPTFLADEVYSSEQTQKRVDWGSVVGVRSLWAGKCKHIGQPSRVGGSIRSGRGRNSGAVGGGIGGWGCSVGGSWGGYIRSIGGGIRSGRGGRRSVRSSIRSSIAGRGSRVARSKRRAVRAEAAA